MTEQDEPTSIGLANHLINESQTWQLTIEEKIAALNIALRTSIEELEFSNMTIEEAGRKR